MENISITATAPSTPGEITTSTFKAKGRGNLPQRKRSLAFAARARTIRSLLGHRLFALAKGITSIETKASLLDAVRSTKGRKKISQVVACELIAEFVTGRQTCVCERHSYPRSKNERSHDSSITSPMMAKRRDVWLSPIARRLEITKANRRKLLIAQCYRQSRSSWVGGKRHIGVEYSDAPSASGYSEKVWHEKKVRSGTNSFLTVAFSPTWAMDVADQGIAVVDGMLTTHAVEVEPGAYRASWVEQGAGFSLRAVSGYIVIKDEESAHGASLAAAKQCIRRRRPEYNEELRRRETEREKKWTSIRTMLETGDAAQFANISVILEDSFRCGNCESGTNHWVNKHFPGRAAATVAELLRIADQSPRVIAACLQAIRRTRASK